MGRSPRIPSVTELPAPPWRLKGKVGFALLGLARLEGLGVSLPPGVEPLKLPGGLVPFVMTATRYDPASTLCYSEFLLAPLVRTPKGVACLPLILLVDDDTSRRGGIELWHLPKEMAEFDWESRSEAGGLFGERKSYELKLRQGEQPVFDGWWMPRGLRLQAQLKLRMASWVGDKLVPWRMEAKAAWRLAGAFQEMLPGTKSWGWKTLVALHLEEFELEVPALPGG